MLDSVATVFEKKMLFGCEGYSPLTNETNFHDQNVQANGVAVLAIGGAININIASAHTVKDGGYEKAGIKIGSALKAVLNSDDSGKFLVTFGDQHVGGPSAELVNGLRQELGKNFPIVGAAAGQSNAKEIVAGEICEATNVGVLISGGFTLGVATSSYTEDLPTTTTYAISSAMSQSKGKPVMAFLFDCGGRRGKMVGQKQLKAEFDNMKNGLGDIPFFGFYGGGEIGPVDRNSPSKGVGFSVATAVISVDAATEPFVSQSVSRFYRPESCTFSLDGKFLYVTSCGSGFYGVDAEGKEQFSLAQGKGAVSKLSVAEDGTLTMIEPKFYPGTSGALGISALPVATKSFPAGSLFFNSGFFMQTDADDKYIDNQKELDPAVVVIDPNSGKLLGKISLAIQGAVCRAINNPLFVPNGLCFDHEGNLYLGETGGVNELIKGAGAITNKSGAVMIPYTAIDALAAGVPAQGIKFLEAPAINGVAFDKKSDCLLMLTFTGSESGDSVYKISRKEFDAGILPRPFVTGLGKLDGIAVTPSGTMVVTDVTNQSLIRIDQNRNVETIDLGGKKFNGPSDISIKTLDDGSSIVVVPEQNYTAPKEWSQNVHVIKLPVGY